MPVNERTSDRDRNEPVSEPNGPFPDVDANEVDVADRGNRSRLMNGGRGAHRTLTCASSRRWASTTWTPQAMHGSNECTVRRISSGFVGSCDRGAEKGLPRTARACRRRHAARRSRCWGRRTGSWRSAPSRMWTQWPSAPRGRLVESGARGTRRARCWAPTSSCPWMRSSRFAMLAASASSQSSIFSARSCVSMPAGGDAPERREERLRADVQAFRARRPRAP